MIEFAVLSRETHFDVALAISKLQTRFDLGSRVISFAIDRERVSRQNANTVKFISVRRLTSHFRVKED